MKKNFAHRPRMIALAVATIAVASVTPVCAEELKLPKQFVVKSMDDIELPAMEAGVLMQLSVREGSQVRAGEVIGKIYDSEALIKVTAAGYGVTAAEKRFENKIQIEYAEASAEVAKATVKRMEQANAQAPGTVPFIELLEKRLERKASLLSIEKAEHEQELTEYEFHIKEEELHAAQIGLERRTIRALFNGEVVEIARKQGEWVNPGDPVLRLVGFETMWVDGSVDQTDYDPHEIANCRVTVEVEMARGRKEQVNGRVAYVSSELTGGKRYLVRTELPNRKEFGRWLLRPGMRVWVTIHLGTGGRATANVSRAQ